MKKLKLYIFSFTFLAVFVLSETKPFMEWWSEYRIQKLHCPYTRARYGDLYSGCFLPQFMDTVHGKLKTYTSTRRSVDLYVLHDSYLADQLKKENFIGLDSLILIDLRGEGKKIFLNKKKRNILIIECSERAANWRLTDTATSFSKLFSNNKKSAISFEQHKPLITYLFNPFINQNLEFNLFDYEIFKPLKQIKAKTNFFLFDKLPKDIQISTDKQYLFLNETIDLNYLESSFRWIPNREIDDIAYLLNLTSSHFKKLGFNQFYFSIIPNPVSVLDRDRGNYNYKIGRIQSTGWLRAQYVDIYEDLRNSKKRVYRRDDSHWNSNGLQMWVNKVNTQILSR